MIRTSFFTLPILWSCLRQLNDRVTLIICCAGCHISQFSCETESVQCLADLQVRLAMISKHCSFCRDFGIGWTKFHSYRVFRASWSWGRQRGFQAVNQEYPNGAGNPRHNHQRRLILLERSIGRMWEHRLARSG